MTPAVRLLLHAAGATQRLATATPLPVGGRRTWWQRVAGSRQRVPLAQLDADAPALPERIAVFDDAMLNRDLYPWLAAQAAHLDPHLPWPRPMTWPRARRWSAFPGLGALAAATRPSWLRGTAPAPTKYGCRPACMATPPCSKHLRPTSR